MAASIIPSPGAPGVPANVTTPILLDHDVAVGAGQTLYSDILPRLFDNYGLQTDYYDLVNGGRIWARLTGDVRLIDAYNFGRIVNSGLVVAESGSGNALAFTVGSAFEGLTNSGQIYALAPAGDAVVMQDWSSVAFTNSGLIAARGHGAWGIVRNNGGQIVNTAAGSILAEGANAVAVYLGRGHIAFPELADIDNAGVIRAVSTGSTPSVGVYLDHYGFENMKIANSGVIAGDIAIIAGNYGATTIVNEASGRIEGAIVLDAGNDLIVNRGQITGDVYLGVGDDRIDSAAGRISGVVDLGWGQDVFIGGAGAEAVVGDRGDDDLSGGGGADLLLGGRGDDRLTGGAGADGLYGEYGDDLITTSGSDRVDAGDGDDTVVLGDLQFALVDGGVGRDVLTFAGDATPLDLSAALASNRIAGFEAIALAGAQELVVRAADVGVFGHGDPLVIWTTAAGKLDLVGSWSSAGVRSIAGVQYRSYVSGSAEVLVQGDGAVALLGSAPAGATGLAPIAGGTAPLPGSTPGAELVGSVTETELFQAASPLTIDRDETWITHTSYALLTDGASLVNHGRIEADGNADGARAIGAYNFGSITNTGVIEARGAGNAADLEANQDYLATYRIDAAVGNLQGNVYGVTVGSLGGRFWNSGTIQASSEASVAVGYQNWFMQEARNDGTLAAASSRFVAVGLYAHNGGDLINTGTIRADGDRGAYAVRSSTHAASIDNQGDIVATTHAAGAESVGVSFYYVNTGMTSVLRNSGTISADVAVRTDMFGAVNVYNSGEIHGRIELNLNPYGAAGAMDLIVNTGLIDGVVRLGGERDGYFAPGGTQRGAVYGEDGSDVLFGGVSNDELDGGNGDDVLLGGAGADTLTGGAGKDVFVYRAWTDSTAGSTDRILDFQTGVDQIDLSALQLGSATITTAGGVSTVTGVTAGGTFSLQVQGAVAQSDLILGPAAAVDGTAQADVLVATAGGASLQGGDGDDTLVGSAGGDTLNGGAGGDMMWGGLGDDLYLTEGVGGEVRELAGEGVDTVEARPIYGWYVLEDNVENLRLATGANGTGNALANVITGNDGRNKLDGAAGADTLIGQGGDDEYVVDDLLDVVVETAGGGRDSVLAWASHTLEAEVENLTLAEGAGSIDGGGNDLANLISGNESANQIRAGGGDDTVYGWAGDDDIDGGDGADILQGQLGDDVVSGGGGDDSAWGEQGADVLYGGDGDDRLSGTERPQYDYIIGGYRTIYDDFAVDRLYGGAGADMLDGAGGDDVLDGGDGADLLNGGLGVDTASYADATAGVVVSLLNTGAQATLGAGSDTLVSIENLAGSDFADSLHGDGGANLLAGGGGDDVLEGGGGDDVLDGGDGSDTASYADATARVTVDLRTTTRAQDTVGAGVDTLASIENLIGSAYADRLQGSGEANVLAGGDGDDVLLGSGGADVLAGGAGADLLDGGTGVDTADYSSATGGITINLNAMGQAADTGGAGVDTLKSVENLVGSAFNDSLRGHAGTNVIEGGDGDDVIEGGGGHDRLFGGAGIDTASYANSTAAVTVRLAKADAQVTGGAGSDTLNGFENLTGSRYADRLTGDEGNNVLTGLGGDDLLDGGAGNDVLDGGGNVDTATYAGATSGVTVNLTLSGPQDTGGAGIDTLISIENVTGSAFNDSLRGNTGGNVLIGGAGDDVLEGGGGEDRLDGGTGNDTASYAHSAAAVTINLNAGGTQATGGAGTDTLISIENVTGSAFADTLRGNAVANVLDGGSGNDVLIGGGGNDTLIGGAGNDLMTGGTGDDLFVFGTGFGQDRIDDFVAGGTEDRLDFSAFAGTGVTWTLTQVGDDAVFSFSDGSTLTLAHVQTSGLTQTGAWGWG